MLIKVCCFSISPYDPENNQVRVQPVLHTYCIYVGQVHISGRKVLIFCAYHWKTGPPKDLIYITCTHACMINRM